MNENRDSCRPKLFGLERNVFVLGMVSFFNDLSSETVYPLLPLFLTETLGAGALFLGLVEGLADFIASLLQVFSGWISDHTRKRKGLAVAGYSVSGVARGTLAVATGPWQVLMAWFFNRVGKGLRSAPRDALIADSCSPEERGRSFGFHRAMDHMGALFGAALASILLAAVTSSYRVIFAIAFIPAVVGVFLLVAFVKERQPAALPANSAQGAAEAAAEAAVRTGAGAPKLSLSLKPFDRRFKLFLLAILVFTLGNSSDAFLLLRARQSGGMSVALIPALWGVLHVVKVVANLRGGERSDRLGRRRVILAGWVIYAFAYLGFAVASSATWFWAPLRLLRPLLHVRRGRQGLRDRPGPGGAAGDGLRHLQLHHQHNPAARQPDNGAALEGTGHQLRLRLRSGHVADCRGHTNHHSRPGGVGAGRVTGRRSPIVHTTGSLTPVAAWCGLSYH